MICDAHVHIGRKDGISLSVEDLLAAMDKHHVDKACVCPGDAEIAVYNRRGNRSLLRIQREHPDRLFCFAAVNPWYGKKAVRELERALGEGLCGLKLNSSLQGFLLCSSLVDPVIECAQEFQAPVYCHTGTPIHSTPFQLAELARRFPDVDFIMGHSGYADFWYDAVPAAVSASNVCLETSYIIDAVLTDALDKIGPDRIVFGSDMPVGHQQLELDKVIGLFGAETRSKILGENMVRLLKR